MLDQAQVDEIVARTEAGENLIVILEAMGVDWQAGTNWLQENPQANGRIRAAEKLANSRLKKT
jgi:hypothetical protein